MRASQKTNLPFPSLNSPSIAHCEKNAR
jgi:hypothetical protein